MVTFIYGLPGSGKTHTILESMKRDTENGIRSFLIVPEQETVSAERQALLTLPPAAQLSAEVLNFSRLANRVFREYGGLSYRYIDKGAKALLMHFTAKELASSFRSLDSGSAKDPSLSEWLLSAVSEMKASCITAEQLAETAKKLSEDDPLRLKLDDLAMISAAYEARIETGFDDAADDLSKLSELLTEHDFFHGTHVYVDSFTSFTRQELNVLHKIARSADALTVTFSCPSPHAKDLHLASVVDTVREIRRITEGLPHREITLTENHRVVSESLSLLSESIWHLEYTENCRPEFPSDVASHVLLLSAPSVYSEAESIAHRILSLVRQGYRYRDIAVITRDASKLSGILDFILEKYEIPYYISEKEDLISLPPMKLLLAALRCISMSFRTADVIALVKTGLCDVSTDDADRFEEYITTWGICGTGFTKDQPWDMNPDGYSEFRSRRAETILKSANRVRETVIPPLIRLADALSSAKEVREEADALLSYLSELRLEEKIDRLAAETLYAGRRQTADIYARLYPLLTDLIQKIAELSEYGISENAEPVSPLSAEELEAAFRILLRTEEIGTIPTAVDEVTVGSAHMLRTSGIRCAILFGLCEGEFPAAIDDGGVFSSAERARLASLSLPLSQTYDFRASDELMYVSRAMAAPSELLILSTHLTAADGSSTRPSMPFLRARLLLGQYGTPKEDDALPILDRILTPRLSLEYYPALKNTAAGEALRRIYSEDGLFSGITDASEIPVSDTNASVSRACAEDIFTDRMRLSQTRLEQYVKCPFSYYCTYVLSLRECGPVEFAASDSGTFIHAVLERFLLEAMKDRTNLPDFTREEIERIASEIVEAYKAEILPPSLSMEDAGRLPHLYRRLYELSIMMIENILDEFSASEFTPRFFELDIGKTEGISPLLFTLKDGSTLTIPGVIDRVDLWKKDNRLYVRIVDYKTGTKEFSLSDLDSGLNTQMLIYLFTLCHSKEFFDGIADAKDCTVVPAGALYHSSALSEVSLETYPDAEQIDVRSEAEKGFHRTGILLNDNEILRAMNHDLDKHFLPGISSSRRSAVGSKDSAAFLTADRLSEIEETISEVITNVAETMRSGHAKADPLSLKGKKSPCLYCKMRPVCRLCTEKRDDDDDTADSD